MENKLQHDESGIPLMQNFSTLSSAKLPAEVSQDLSLELANQAKKAFVAMEGRH